MNILNKSIFTMLLLFVAATVHASQDYYDDEFSEFNGRVNAGDTCISTNFY
jgi:hypothetical protein